METNFAPRPPGLSEGDRAFWRSQPKLSVLTAAYLLAGEPLPEKSSDFPEVHSLKVAASLRLIELRTGAVDSFEVHGPVGEKMDVPPFFVTQEQFSALEKELGTAVEPKATPLAGKAAAPESDRLAASERDKLLRQIGGLALLLAEKSKLYKRAGKPNASQIANAVGEIADAIPDAQVRGLGSTELRVSIAAGLSLLAADELSSDN